MKENNRKEETKEERKDTAQIEAGFYQNIVLGSTFTLKCVNNLFLSSSIHADRVHIIQRTMLTHILQRTMRNFKRYTAEDDILIYFFSGNFQRK